MKMKKFETAIEILYLFHCPACKFDHMVRTKGDGPTWEVTGIEEDNPTVSPSILVNAYVLGGDKCHSFVRNGKIEYLPDCSHSLAGKIADMVDYDTEGDYIVPCKDQEGR
jgi:hypothetical protein